MPQTAVLALGSFYPQNPENILPAYSAAPSGANYP